MIKIFNPRAALPFIATAVVVLIVVDVVVVSPSASEQTSRESNANAS
jgi:hypothetical protein